MCVSNYELPVLITVFGSVAACRINEKLPVALRSKAQVCGRLIAWIAGWNSTDGVDVLVCLLCGMLIVASVTPLITRSEESCGLCGI